MNLTASLLRDLLVLGGCAAVASFASGAQAAPAVMSRPAGTATPATAQIQVKLTRAKIMELPDTAVLVGPAAGQRITGAEAKAALAALQGKLSASSAREARSAHQTAGRRARDVAAQLANENRLATIAAAALPPTGASTGQSGMMRPAVSPAAPAAPGAVHQAALCPATSPIVVHNVNGRHKGTVFTPGGRYVIAGCAFGAQTGRVTVGGASTTGQVQTVDLKVDSWTPSAIVAHVDAALGGVGDISAATFTVIAREGQATLASQQFLAARDLAEVPMTKTLVELNVNGNWAPRYDGGIASRNYLALPEGAHGVAATGVGEDDNTAAYGNKFCSPWVVATDHWHTEKLVSLLAAQGFELDSAKVDDLTPSTTGEDDNVQATNLGTFAVAWNGDQLDVTPRGNSLYAKEQFWVSDAGYSVCKSRYRVAVLASGPRGVTPRLK